MSTVNAEIPLSVNTSGFDIQKALTLGELANKLRMQNQEIQGQNALKTIFTQPGSIDDQGNPTPKAIQATMAVAPKAGMELRSTMFDGQAKQLQMQHYKTEVGKAKFDFMTSVAAAATDAYDSVIKGGGSPEQATDAATKARNEATRANGGTLSDQEADSVYSKPYVHEQAQALASLNPAYRAERKEDATEQRDERRLDQGDARLDQGAAAEARREKEAGVRDSIMLRGLEQREEGMAPATKAYNDFMKLHPDATPDEQARFIQSSKSAPRSAPAMAMAKYLQEHPDATAEDVEKFNADLKSTAKATSDFATGKQGQQVNSFNVGISHLDTLKDLGQALKNGNTKVFNQVANKWAEETGNPAPTNFNTAKQIIGAEVVKSIVGAGGGVAERQEASNNISAASSPEQLLGAIETTQRLMGGQLRGLQRQYEDTTKKKDFLDRLTPEARKVAETLDKGDAGAKTLPAKNAKGWSLHKDAQGNQAYVSPDGTQFEEVK